MTIFRATALGAAMFVILASGAAADDTGLASMHDLRKEGGRTCMTSHAHSGAGVGRTKPAAMKAALQSWYEYTAWEYGTVWARWAKSAAKRVSYTKEPDGWAASVESRPCR